ncbi:hypothetical protein GKZ68_00325 [Hymenobacter sp. BRD128]|uniref:hypothetical protein n=1 Tax=Hymenobacter sp. BRD128 TaxID=2675878 RepID=UPI0015643720|nr:hypothetical protein [Hymenobacter sp. BRD128]QKG55217.1 hypothetical protein GKZ68_00325 [Hymenobacter sp. BRD128]
MPSAATMFNPATDCEIFDLHYDSQQPACVAATQPGFRGRAAAQVGYKIYVLVNAAGVQYVGCTRTSMGARLRLGHQRFRTPRGGYHGYQWLKLPALRLFVFPLPPALLALDAAHQTKPSQLAERIEAELVYAVRAHTGQWPLHQTEIHFHTLPDQPELATLTTSLAQQLYEHVTQPLPVAIP